ncbi:hypothetical protein EVAR_63158_1 [Eumeta japonica]|uniref:Uncharacterized protein n=1 Tax=Eumeta variegata TaxID=151549 RepID=A0A4C1YYW2_EUMVA|nr:hypothetical protein EVAR_63158_1 [Eumeta japonica]
MSPRGTSKETTPEIGRPSCNHAHGGGDVSSDPIDLLEACSRARCNELFRLKILVHDEVRPEEQSRNVISLPCSPDGLSVGGRDVGARRRLRKIHGAAEINLQQTLIIKVVAAETHTVLSILGTTFEVNLNIRPARTRAVRRLELAQGGLSVPPWATPAISTALLDLRMSEARCQSFLRE